MLSNYALVTRFKKIDISKKLMDKLMKLFRSGITIAFSMMLIACGSSGGESAEDDASTDIGQIESGITGEEPGNGLSEGGEPLDVPNAGNMDENNNSAPVIRGFSGSPTPVMVNDAVTFSWDVVDVDGDAIICSVDADGDGIDDHTVANCTSDSMVTHFYNAPGDYTPRLTVIDPFDALDFEESEESEIHVLPLLGRISSISPAQADGRTQIELRVSNVSMTPVNNVQVLHRVPAEYSYRFANDVFPDSRGCSVCADGSESTWTFASLQPGENQLITINALLAEDVIAGDVVPAPFFISADNMRAQINLTEEVVVDNRPVSEVIVSSRALTAEPGGEFNLDVSVGNIDNVDLSNVRLTLDIPQGVNVVNVPDADGVFDETARTVSWAIDSVTVLESVARVVDLQVSLDAVDGVSLPFRAVLSHDNGSGIEPSSEFSIPVVDSNPDLSMTVDMLRNPVTAGMRAQTRITISNTSLIPINDVLLFHRIPVGISYRFSSDTTPRSSGCSVCEGGDESFWQFDSLAAGESFTILINANVSDLLQGGTIRSLPFTLTASGINVTQHQRLVARIANQQRVSIATTVSKSPMVAGEELNVRVDIGNSQAQAFQSGSLALQIPTGFSLISVDTAGGAQNGQSNAIEWDALTVEGSSVSQFEVTLAANSDLGVGSAHLFQAIFDLPDTSQVDAIADGSVAISEVESPLSVEISTVQPTATPGERLRYIFTLTNNGLIPLRDAQLRFRVPQGLSYRFSDDANPNGRGCTVCTEGDESFWTFESIAAGASEIIELNSNVIENIAPGSIIAAPVYVDGESLINTIFTVHTVPVE